MALLTYRHPPGNSSSGIARDLSEAMDDALKQHSSPDQRDRMEIAESREWTEEYCRIVSPPAKSRQVPVEQQFFETADLKVGARVLNPSRADRTLVFIHGGGWCSCSLDTHDHIARWMADELSARVVMIDYSLAPESPFPTAINECTAVISAVLGEATEGHRVIVVGDSAGANIGAMAILGLSESRKKQIAGFVSIYGAYAPDMNLSSHKLYGDGGFGLSEAQMSWLWENYAPQVAPGDRNRLLSPVGADLARFPRTLCIAAEYDILFDDTLVFYAALARASVEVSLCLWPDLPHGCLHFVDRVESVTRAAGVVIDYAASRFRQAHSGK